MRIWVVPDIHGCLKTFRYLLEERVKLRKEDKLFILGDVIDRGPDSKGVIDHIMRLEDKGYDVTTLRGNHEDHMLKVIESEKHVGLRSMLGIGSKMRKEWFKFGGDATLKSFMVSNSNQIPDIYADWLTALPYYAEIGKFLIVHAGFNFRRENIFEDKESMMWIRDYEIDPDKLNGRRIIHGHVPVDLEFLNSCLKSSSYHFIALDNGVYMHDRPGYGNLTALELNTMELLVQQNLDQ